MAKKTECKTCGSIFYSKVNRKHKNLCWSCIREEQVSAAEAQFRESLYELFPEITLLRYDTRKSKFKCTKGHTFFKSTSDALRAVHGCPKCGAESAGKEQRMTHKEFMQQVREKPRLNLRILGKYVTSQAPLHVSCKKCDRDWYAKPNTILNYTSTGCRACSFASLESPSNLQKYTQVEIDGKQFNIQGYEAHVIKHIAKKIHVRDIHCSSSGLVPTIDYTFQKRVRLYYPDLKVKNTLIEVKSLWTLFKDWKLNQAKAVACVKAGYKFRLYLVEKGVVYQLPQEWIHWKEDVGHAYVNKLLVKSVTILAMDPGVQNFAWTVIKVSRPFKIEILGTGTIKNTLKTLVGDMIPSMSLFLDDVKTIAKQFNIDRLVAERFSSRGLKGLSIELIGIMLGAILSGLPNSTKHLSINRTKLVMAATWKNEFNKVYPLDTLYKKTPFTPHKVDSTLIGLYAASLWLNERPFSLITVRDIRRLFKLNEKANPK